MKDPIKELREAVEKFVKALSPWVGHKSIPMEDLDRADRFARAVLSRHPVPAKSEDRCAEMVKKANDDGFHHGMALALISIGRDNDQPTLAKDVAEGYGLKIKDFEGHGIDPMDMTKLKSILSEFSKDAGKEGKLV